MKIIDTMPKILGSQLYPGGFPLRADHITYLGKTIQQINDEAMDLEMKNEPPIAEHTKILTDYYLYYLQAPIWKIDDIEKIFNMSLHELDDLCYEVGLDPF